MFINGKNKNVPKGGLGIDSQIDWCWFVRWETARQSHRPRRRAEGSPRLCQIITKLCSLPASLPFTAVHGRQLLWCHQQSSLLQLWWWGLLHFHSQDQKGMPTSAFRSCQLCGSSLLTKVSSSCSMLCGCDWLSVHLQAYSYSSFYSFS